VVNWLISTMRYFHLPNPKPKTLICNDNIIGMENA